MFKKAKIMDDNPDNYDDILNDFKIKEEIKVHHGDKIH